MGQRLISVIAMIVAVAWMLCVLASLIDHSFTIPSSVSSMMSLLGGALFGKIIVDLRTKTFQEKDETRKKE